MTLFLANHEPDAAGREHDAGLHRPQDAVDRRPDRGGDVETGPSPTPARNRWPTGDCM